MHSNIALFYWINHLAVDHTWLEIPAIFLAKYSVLLLVLAFVFYWFRGKLQQRIMLVCAALSVLIASVLGKLSGLLHQNLQPFAMLENVNQLVAHAIDNSFPSDHSIVFFAVCSSFFLFKLQGRYIWLILAVFVAISRIMVGVHYPLDVAVGALTGIISAVLMYSILPRQSLIQDALAYYSVLENRLLASFKKH